MNEIYSYVNNFEKCHVPILTHTSVIIKYKSIKLKIITIST